MGLGALGTLGALGAGVTMGVGAINQREKLKQDREMYTFKKDQMEDERTARNRTKDVNATIDAEYARLGQDRYETDPLPEDQMGPPTGRKVGTIGLADVKMASADALARKGYGREAEAARKELELYKAEGVDKAITAFKRGASGEELAKIFNDHGDHRVKGIDKIDYKTGEISYLDHAGQPQSMNVNDIERRMLSLKDQAGLKKDEATTRKANSEADEKDAEIKAGVPGAKADSYKANAVQSRAAAGASNASAASANYTLQQEKLADSGAAKPAADRTPAEKAALARRETRMGHQDPADVKTTKWLMENIPALGGDAKKAWDLHQQSKGKDPATAMADIKGRLLQGDKFGTYSDAEGNIDVAKLNAHAQAIISGGKPAEAEAPGLAAVKPTTTTTQPAGPRKRPLSDFGS
jgi:hypothetical protein